MAHLSLPRSCLPPQCCPLVPSQVFTTSPVCTPVVPDVDCVGAWSSWGACSGAGTQTRSFSVTTSQSGSGSACAATDGDVEYQCCSPGWTGSNAEAQSNSCADVDECTLGTDNCTQVCTNSPAGSFTCSCDQPGYVLLGDGFTCSSSNDCDSTYQITVADSDPAAGSSSVRVSYRSDANDAVASDNTAKFGAGGKACSAAAVSGFTCSETAHGLSITGGTGAGSITLRGPGTLKVKGLDLGATAISVPGGKGTDVNGVAQDASLTGSYSDCSGDASVAGSISGSVVPGVTGESGLSGADTTGTTGSGGTWHAQDDDCHDIVTGKRLAPENIDIISDTTITKPSGGTGFSLEYEFDDTYETTVVDGTVAGIGCTISNHNTNTVGGSAGSGAPTTANAKDTDGRDLWFAGEIHHDGGASARAYLLKNGVLTGDSFASGSSPITVTATAVERSKFSPVNNHYEWAVANCGSPDTNCDLANALKIELMDVAYHVNPFFGFSVQGRRLRGDGSRRPHGRC